MFYLFVNGARCPFDCAIAKMCFFFVFFSVKEFCINGWSVCAIVVWRPMRENGNPGKWPIERIGFVSLGWQTAELRDWWQSRSAGYFFNVFDFIFFWPLSGCRIQSWIELEMSCNWSDAQTERIIHRDTLHKRFTKWVRVFLFFIFISLMWEWSDEMMTNGCLLYIGNLCGGAFQTARKSLKLLRCFS